MLDRDVTEIRVLSRDEAKQDQMRHELNDARLRFYLGDVRDYDCVARAVHNTDYVFHAAALKQVPSCEFFPMEAVRTNVIGSANVIRACVHAGVRSVVCLSTDKAVYPVNAMGMTKALMEKVARSYGLNNKNGDTIVCCVRYGNVMYSRGSVIPLFVSQIKAGKKLTVTNPKMTRFMMSLIDSVDLVEFAFGQARQGDLFIRKARACTIEDLARAVLSLFGVEREMEIIGTRHAEKVCETLATREELARAEDMGDYFRIPADDRDLNYELYVDRGDVGQTRFEDYDSDNAERMGVQQVRELLLTLPEIASELRDFGLLAREGASW